MKKTLPKSLKEKRMMPRSFDTHHRLSPENNEMNPLFRNPRFYLMIWCLLALLAPESAFAAVPQQNVLDGVIERFRTTSSTWESKIVGHATTLFWLLNVISLAWGLILQAINKADLPDVFGEIFRHVMFTGFHYWLLVNGAGFAGLIISSLRQAAGEATGGSSQIGPSDVIDIGLNIAGKALSNFSMLAPVDSLGYIIISAIILICLAIIAANLVIMLCSAWIMSYAGILFLGFGGSKWTSDMAINYYKTVLGIGASLFAMTLLLGIGQSVMNDFAQAMSPDAPMMEMMVCMVMAVVLMLLIDKLPGMMAGIVTGSVGGGFQGYGAGAGMAAAGLAVGAVAGLAAGALAAGSEVAGGMEAMKQAAALADVQAGGDSDSSDMNTDIDTSGTSGAGGGSIGAASAGGDSGSSGGSGGWMGAARNLVSAAGSHMKDSLQDKVDAAISNTTGGKLAQRMADQRQQILDERAESTEAGGTGDAPRAGGSGTANELDASAAFDEGALEDGDGPELSDEMKDFVNGKK